MRDAGAALPAIGGAGPPEGREAVQGAARAAPQAAQAAAPANASGSRRGRGAAAAAPAPDAPKRALAPPPPCDVTYEGRPLVAVNITVALPAGTGQGACQAEVCGHRVRVRVPGHQSLELALPLGVAAGGGGAAAVLDARERDLRLRLPSGRTPTAWRRQVCLFYDTNDNGVTSPRVLHVVVAGNYGSCAGRLLPRPDCECRRCAGKPPIKPEVQVAPLTVLYGRLQAG